MKDDFVKNLKTSLAILKLIDLLNVKYRSDSIPISEVMPDFHGLPARFERVYCCRIISKQKREYLIQLTKKSFQSMYSVAHGLVYLLDPVLLKEGLPVKKRLTLEDILINTPEDDITSINEDRKEQIYVEYTRFIILAMQEKTSKSFFFKWWPSVGRRR